MKRHKHTKMHKDGKIQWRACIRLIRKKGFLQFSLDFLNKMKYDRIDVYAAQASFYILMSIVPIMMLLFMLLKFTPLKQELVIEALEGVVNEQVMTTVRSVIGNVYHTSVAAVSFAAVALVWTSGRAVLGLAAGLNNIYHVEETRNYLLLRIRASFYTIVMILVFIISACVIMFGNRIEEWLQKWITIMIIYDQIVNSLKGLLGMALLTVIFWGMYVLLPSGKRSIINQLPGAIFSTLTWWIFTGLFNLYLSFANNMSVIYGSLVTLVVFMLWSYGCMYLWLLGAQVNAFLEKPVYFETENILYR